VRWTFATWQKRARKRGAGKLGPLLSKRWSDAYPPRRYGRTAGVLCATVLAAGLAQRAWAPMVASGLSEEMAEMEQNRALPSTWKPDLAVAGLTICEIGTHRFTFCLSSCAQCAVAEG
jgi:hypothetical protein